MMTIPQLKTPKLTGNSSTDKRSELKAYFEKTWATYESLFSLINNDEAYYLKPEPLRHPLVFYFGHTATFFINKLILGKYIPSRLNEKLEAICAVGVDEMSWDDLNSEHYDWPTIEEIRDYRVEVASLVLGIIDTMPLTLPIKQDSLAWIILMGCEHERIHLETSSVIIRMLPLQYLSQNNQWLACRYHDEPPVNKFIPVDREVITLGKPQDDETYGWDNEYGETITKVEPFAASKFLISNGEFLKFVEQGGYKNTQYWNEEGKHWLAYTKASMPRFWLLKTQSETGSNCYLQRNLVEEIPLPLNWPAEVNYLEAKAYCNWQSELTGDNIRLPTEAEWYCLRNKVSSDLVDWQKAPGNINLEYFASASPVNEFETDGIFDVIGNVWQWTESPIDGFNGFEVHPLYDDFSTPTFDGRHNLIKGGSWISTGNEAIKHSRYAFRRHFTQHAGFRTIKADTPEIPDIEVTPYETNISICTQLESHYGDNLLSYQNYPQQIAFAVKDAFAKHQGGLQKPISSLLHSKLLNIGCSVGRCAFELSPYFDQVDAVDFSASLIQHGVQLQNNNIVKYVLEKEGDIVEHKEISLNNLPLNQFNGLESTLLQHANKVKFSQGDASNLKAVFTGYDVILAQHVIEQSYHPAKFLQDVKQRLNSNGLLIIVSDYHFTETTTEKDKWLSGLKINGENVSGIDGLSNQLSTHFTLIEQAPLMRAIKENQRHLKISECELSVWQLKS
jgi:5-histidylcysteine sulfoxide synthase/putative 4-mercaptohistidine N1-methyltranferase